MDLKDKFKNIDIPLVSNSNVELSSNNINIRDAISALENLGYNRNNVAKAIDKVHNQSSSLEELIKLGLKELVWKQK